MITKPATSFGRCITFIIVLFYNSIFSQIWRGICILIRSNFTILKALRIFFHTSLAFSHLRILMRRNNFSANLKGLRSGTLLRIEFTFVLVESSFTTSLRRHFFIFPWMKLTWDFCTAFDFFDCIFDLFQICFIFLWTKESLHFLFSWLRRRLRFCNITNLLFLC